MQTAELKIHLIGMIILSMFAADISEIVIAVARRRTSTLPLCECHKMSLEVYACVFQSLCLSIHTHSPPTSLLFI